MVEQHFFFKSPGMSGAFKISSRTNLKQHLKFSSVESFRNESSGSNFNLTEDRLHRRFLCNFFRGDSMQFLSRSSRILKLHV